MKPTSDLFQLIKSLTASEKRYFKLHAKRHGMGKKHSYETLFDLLDKQPDDWQYDEAALKQQLKKRGKGKHFADSKKQLEEQVLMAMRFFHYNGSARAALEALMKNERLLQTKALPQLQIKTLEKAKQLAYKYEEFELLLEILDRERLLNMTLNDQRQLQRLEENAAERKQILQLLQTIADLNDASAWMFLQLRFSTRYQTEKVLSDADEKINAWPFKKHQCGKCFRADYNYYRTLTFYYLMKKEFKKSNDCAEKMFLLYDNEFPHFKIERPDNYRVVLQNYMSVVSDIEDWELFKSLLDKLKALKPANDKEAADYFEFCTLQEQLYLINIGQLEKSESLIPEIIAGENKHRKLIHTGRMMKIYNNIAVTLFLSSNWNKCIHWLQKILNEKTESTTDVKIFAHQLLTICHFELQHYDLIDYMLRNIGLSKKYQSAAGDKLKQQLQLLKKALKLGNTPKDFQQLLPHQNILESEIRFWLNARAKKMLLKEYYVQSKTDRVKLT